jgi:hypothetical protein
MQAGVTPALPASLLLENSGSSAYSRGAGGSRTHEWGPPSRGSQRTACAGSWPPTMRRSRTWLPAGAASRRRATPGFGGRRRPAAMKARRAACLPRVLRHTVRSTGRQACRGMRPVSTLSGRTTDVRRDLHAHAGLSTSAVSLDECSIKSAHHLGRVDAERERMGRSPRGKEETVMMEFLSRHPRSARIVLFVSFLASFALASGAGKKWA